MAVATETTSSGRQRRRFLTIQHNGGAAPVGVILFLVFLTLQQDTAFSFTLPCLSQTSSTLLLSGCTPSSRTTITCCPSPPPPRCSLVSCRAHSSFGNGNEEQDEDGNASDRGISTTAVTTAATTRPVLREDDDVRAGEDGYSLQRKPVTLSDWDPNSDVVTIPSTKVDLMLDETNGDDSLSLSSSSLHQRQQLDLEWWSSSSSSSSRSRVDEKGQPQKQQRQDQQQQQQQQREHKDVDLLSRTLETLDYPRVLEALRNECCTVPGRKLVEDATRHMPAKTTTVERHDRTRGSDRTKAPQPLIADSARGAVERYRAVRELQWLLRGGGYYHDHHRDDDEDESNKRDKEKFVQLDDSKYYYRNAQKGYKESLIGRPPPVTTNAFDLDSILSVADVQGRVLEGPDLLEISNMIDSMENLVAWSRAVADIEELPFVQLPALVQDGVCVNETLQELLTVAFDEKGRLNGKTFPAVGRLRGTVRALRGEIMSSLESLLSSPSVRSKLATDGGGPMYSQVADTGRLVIPVRSEHVKSMSGGGAVVHDTSRSGRTSYVEPAELVGPTNDLRRAEGELRTEEARAWRELTGEVLRNRRWLQSATDAAGQVDATMARCALGRRWSGRIPTVRNDGVFSVRNAKHPVLLLRRQQDQQDQQQKHRRRRPPPKTTKREEATRVGAGGRSSSIAEEVVGSDIALGADDNNRGLILTGPNAGGKTVVLKLLGLYALMVRAGIPLPAGTGDNNDDYGEENDPPPRVDFFDPVLADIGDMQSVGDDLSTFSGHLLVCKQVLESAVGTTTARAAGTGVAESSNTTNSNNNALVLMDELGSGTDPAQGVALAQAVMEALVEAGARVVITTHYSRLKQLAASDDRFAVAGMQFVRGRPTYRLVPGMVGESYALAVAERLRLPTAVIRRAEELLDSETKQMGDLLRELEDRRADADELAADLEERRRELASAEYQIKQERIRLEKKQLSVRRQEAKKFAAELQEKEEVLEDILRRLQQDPNRRVVAKSWEDIRLLQRDAIRQAENVPSVLAAKERAVAAQKEAADALVPVAEMEEPPTLQPGDKLTVCKAGPLFGREAVVVKVMGKNRVQVSVNNMNVGLKLDQVSLSTMTGKISPSSSRSAQATANKQQKQLQLQSISKAAEKAIRNENRRGSSSKRGRNPYDDDNEAWTSPLDASSTGKSSSGVGKMSVAIRTSSNTVDVRGCSAEQAQEMARSKFSSSIMAGRPVVYILHGHGAQGTLKKRIRQWLSAERRVVKRWQPADAADGGDAFTCVELK